MQKKFLAAITSAVLLTAFQTSLVYAEGTPGKKSSVQRSKTYEEEEFLRLFGHKTRKTVSDALGKPMRVGQSSKPSGAEQTVGRPLNPDKNVSIEMWYYDDLVLSDPKHTWKTVELTFVNDRCMNISYFNTKP